MKKMKEEGGKKMPSSKKMPSGKMHPDHKHVEQTASALHGSDPYMHQK